MSLVEKTSDRIRSSIMVKALGIGFIILLLLIPSSMVSHLVRERKNSYDSAIREISAKWGQEQTVTGPFITIPFEYTTTQSDGQPSTVIRHAHFMPSKLSITGKVEPIVRNRSIYKAILYSTDLEISGSFDKLELEKLNIAPEDLLTEDAVLCMGISDLRGIKKEVKFSWDQEDAVASPGVPVHDVITSGVNIPLRISEEEIANSHDFKVSLSLNGSSVLDFVPVGKTTEVNITSPWASPSFDGAFLPVERSITEKGFDAHWSVLEHNRNFPQQWVDRGYTQNSQFGFKMIIPVDFYQTVTRSVKYAMLFIVLTFATFFTIEILKEYRVHPIQYILIGLALILFYSLLLSFSERIGFGHAYFVASSGIVLMISLYSLTITGKKFFAGLIGAVLGGLYGFLYLLLQLEDNALLLGSVGLFVVLATFMFITRNIDWYQIGRRAPMPEDEL
ncbi:MAG: cell envelope integrity protein CreD [Chitinispirillaceae bacterium]